MTFTDEQLNELWERLGTIPVTDDNVLDADFIINDSTSFQKGTDIEDVWRWFDSMHSKGVYVLMGLNNK